MLHKTGGIVFRHIKFKETSIIATVFTEVFGIQTYVVNSVRSKKPKFGISLFQPLTILDMVVYHKENASINRVSEIRCSDPYGSIPFNVQKSAVAILLSEVMYKSIRHESQPRELYDFIRASLLTFDRLEVRSSYFHLQFLLKLTRFLGFYPQTASQFRSQLIRGDSEMNTEIDLMLSKGYEIPLSMTNAERRAMLENILDFYKLHIEGLGKINSYKILRDVMRN